MQAQPTIIVDQTTYDELIHTLEPLLIDQTQRQALVWSAFHNSPVYRQIDFAGAARPFTINLVHKLLDFGEVASGQHALMLLLDVIHNQVGYNKQQRIRRLQLALAQQLKTRLIITTPQQPARSRLRTLKWIAILGMFVLVGFILWRVHRAGLPVLSTTAAPTVIITQLTQQPLTATPLATAADPPPPPSLKDQVLADMQHSSVSIAYRPEANHFVDTLFAHLDDFQLAHLGITKQTVSDALGQAGVGDRINGIVQPIWAEWVSLANRNGFDMYTTEPTLAEHNLTPFRRLVIRMIQARQGSLVDSEQHALYNLLTRQEDPTVWHTGVGGVIAAINRESFQWP